MSEQLERCRACPERNGVSKVLARLGGVTAPADCAGATIVYRGDVAVQTRSRGEPEPPRDTWNGVVASLDGEESLYFGTNWKIAEVCGRQPVEPQAGEIPYALPGDTAMWVDKDGQQYASFISGPPEGVDAALTVLALVRLLDS